MNKRELTKEQIFEIKLLFEQGFGTRTISKQLNIHRYYVLRTFKELNISNIGKAQRVKSRIIPTERKCRGECSKLLPINNFNKRIKNNHIEYEYDCIDCSKIKQKLKSKNYPIEKKRANQKKYSDKKSTKQKKRQYYLANKEKILIKNRERDNYKRNNDPSYKLRHRVSCVIWQYLNKNNGSKYGHSILSFLPYTIPDLKHHLESIFEPWMSWNNYGPYKKDSWNENDQSTWKWQIDHIAPHSTFIYTSLEDDNFKKCWALSNLRPYSAKQNILDGISRIRH